MWRLLRRCVTKNTAGIAVGAATLFSVSERPVGAVERPERVKLEHVDPSTHSLPIESRRPGSPTMLAASFFSTSKKSNSQPFSLYFSSLTQRKFATTFPCPKNYVAVQVDSLRLPSHFLHNTITDGDNAADVLYKFVGCTVPLLLEYAVDDGEYLVLQLRFDPRPIRGEEPPTVSTQPRSSAIEDGKLFLVLAKSTDLQTNEDEQATRLRTEQNLAVVQRVLKDEMQNTQYWVSSLRLRRR